MNARRAGSVRFDPYYKLQWFDRLTLAWRDVQLRYDTPGAAIAAAATETPPGTEFRLMHVDMDGRRPLRVVSRGPDDFDLEAWA